MSDFQKAKRRVMTEDGYKLLSYATSSESVEMTDGTDLQSTIDNLSEIYQTRNVGIISEELETSWESYPIFDVTNTSSVAYGNGVWLVGGDVMNDGSPFYYSYDGNNWIAFVGSTITSQVSNIAFGNGFFVAYEDNGNIHTSTDGFIWNKTSSIDFTPNRLKYVGGYFFALGSSGKYMYSTDGTTWNSGTCNTVTLRDVAYGNGTYIIVGNTGYTFYSTDAVNWTMGGRAGTGNLFGAEFGKGLFVALGSNGRYYSEDNGLNWNTGNGGTLVRGPLVFSGTHFVGIGTSGATGISNDGINWEVLDSGASSTMQDIAYGDGKFITVSQDGEYVYCLEYLKEQHELEDIINDLWSSSTGGSTGISITVSEYEALPDGEKMNGTIYYISDGVYIMHMGITYGRSDVFHCTQEVYDSLPESKLTDGILYMVEDGEGGESTIEVDSVLSNTSENPVQNKVVTNATTTTDRYANDYLGGIIGYTEPITRTTAMTVLKGHETVMSKMASDIVSIKENGGGVKVVDITQADYDLLENKQDGVLYNIIDADEYIKAENVEYGDSDVKSALDELTDYEPIDFTISSAVTARYIVYCYASTKEVSLNIQVAATIPANTSTTIGTIPLEYVPKGGACAIGADDKGNVFRVYVSATGNINVLSTIAVSVVRFYIKYLI